MILRKIAPHLVALLLFSLAAVFVNWKLLQDGVMYAAEDIWWHIFWLKEFVGELNEGIVYPRWLAQSNFLYGSPTFVFYPPFCYYLGALLQKLFALSIMQTSTALCLVGTFACGLSFYLCGRPRFGGIASICGALLYMTAPFLAFDIYFRASIPESFALVWLPVLMFSLDQQNSRRWHVLLAASVFLLTLTHIPSLFIFLLAWITRMLFCRVIDTNSSGIAKAADRSPLLNLLYAALGLGCASFFLLPLWLERNLVNLSAVLDQSKWQGTLIGSPAYHGHAMVIDIAVTSFGIALILYCLILFVSRFRPEGRQGLLEPSYWLVLNLTALYLMTEASRSIWSALVPLQCLQFPYRFMTVNCFCAAVLLAITISYLLSSTVKKFLQLLIAVLLFLLLVLQMGMDFLITKFRSGLDRPAPHILENDSMRQQEEYARYMMPAILKGADGYPGVPEYRPMVRAEAVNGRADTGFKAPPAPHHGKQALTLVSGEGVITAGSWYSYRRNFSTKSDKALLVGVRTFVYPGWKLYIDGQKAELGQAADGSMLVRLAVGEHRVELKYEDTDAFRNGLVLSIFSFLTLVALWRKSPPVGKNQPKE